MSNYSLIFYTITMELWDYVSMIALVVQVLVHKNTNTCKAGIHPHDHITEEDQGCDETVVGTTRELLHYVGICGVESQCCCGGAFGDEAHPQELEGDKSFWSAQGCFE